MMLLDFKIIWRYIKKHKRTVVATAILAVSFAAFEGIVPYLYGRLVDTVSSDSISFLVLALLGIWAITTFLSAIFKRIVYVRGAYLGVDVLTDFVYDHMSHVVNLPLSFHREKKVGELVSRITRAADHLNNIISNTVFWIAPRFVTLLIGLVIMLAINWRLSLGVLVIFILSVIIAIKRTPLLAGSQKEVSKSFDQSAGILNDSFLNIHTIKSSASEEFQKSKIKSVYLDKVNPALKKNSLIWENTVLFQEIIFSLGFVVVFGYAIYLLGQGVISHGVLVMFLGYLNLTRMPLAILLWQWLEIQRGLAAIKRANEFLDMEVEEAKEEGKIIEDVKGKIEYKNVEFGYSHKRPVLDGLNFTALAGQKVALVGGSGEGKTTTIDLLSLYFTPRKGEILLDGVNIKDLKLKFLRSLIAYVPQEIILFNDTISNNILYGKPNASKKEIVEAAKMANIHDFIERLPDKYNTMVGERGVKLSAGQKQRLAIARAIIRDPKILILDEATSSLDVHSEKMISQALERLTKDKTTFIIAHRLSTVRKADKILVLQKGKIIEQGTHEQLLEEQGAYHKFYNLHI